MFELTARAPSEARAAVLLGKVENQIAETIGAENCMYTLIFGKETQTVEGDSVIRTLRIGILSGIYRYKDSILSYLSKSKAQKRKKALPPGVIQEVR